MNLGEIKQRAKRILGDDSGALYAEDDFIRWINDAQIDIARKTEVLQDFSTYSIVAAQQEYDLPDDFIKIVKISYNGITLKSTTLQEIDSLSPSRDSDSYRDSPYRWYIWGNRLWIHPLPVSDVTDALRIFYVFRPPTLISDNDIPAIPVQMHEDIVQYCVAQGRDLNEDYAGSQLSMGRYEQKVMMSRDEAKDPSMESYPSIRTLPGDMGY